MNKFQDHFHHPRNSKKPTFFQSSLQYAEGDLKVTVFLGVDKKERIETFAYLYEGTRGFIPYFSALSEMCKGMELHDAKELSQESFRHYFKDDSEYSYLVEEEAVPWCNPALILLSKLIEDYEGTFSSTMALMKGQKEEELLCRCFGVYKNEIFNLLKDNLEFLLTDLMAKTKAGAGCKSCQVDLDEMYFATRELFPLKQKPSLVKVGSSYKVQDKSTAQWVLDLDKAINHFCQINGLVAELFEIQKFKYPELRIKVGVLPEKLSLEKLEEKLSYHLEQSTGLKLQLVWKY